MISRDYGPDWSYLITGLSRRPRERHDRPWAPPRRALDQFVRYVATPESGAAMGITANLVAPAHGWPKQRWNKTVGGPERCRQLGATNPMGRLVPAPTEVAKTVAFFGKVRIPVHHRPITWRSTAALPWN